MYSLQSLYRLMLGVWLLLVIGLGVYLTVHVGKDTKGTLYSFFFEESDIVVPPPPVVTPVPKPEPVVEPKPVVPPEWTALEMGKKNGRGTLSAPVITVLDNGDCEVRLELSDEVGNYRMFYPSNVDSISVDFIGLKGKNLLADKYIDKGVLQRVQIAGHRDWVRVSAIARNSTDRLKARVERSLRLKVVRIVFSKD